MRLLNFLTPFIKKLIGCIDVSREPAVSTADLRLVYTAIGRIGTVTNVL